MNEPRPEHDRPLWPLLLLFTISGASGLFYQVVWLRMLIRTFGVTVYAVSTIVAVFMAGLAIGSMAAGRLGARRRLLVTYAILEVMIGLAAALSSLAMRLLPDAFRLVIEAVGDHGPLLVASRVALVALVLLPPTALMGATLPVLSALFTSLRSSAGRQAGLLYGLNSFGAVLGTVATGFFMLGSYGERATLGVAIAINVTVGALAFALARGWPVAAPREETNAVNVAPDADGDVRRRVLRISFMSGACALALEVIWARLSGVLLGNSVYGFSSVLGAYLAGLAIGSAASSRWIARVRKPIALFGCLEIAAAFLSVASIAVFVGLGMRDEQRRFSYALIWGLGDFVRLALYALAVVLPVTLVYGAIFPVTARLVSGGSDGDAARVQREIGRLYAYNTVGGIFGSLVTGFVLVPMLGTLASFLFASLVSLGLGVYLLMLAAGREAFARARLVSLGGSFAVLALAWLVRDDPFLRVLQKRIGRDMKLVAHAEDRGATVTMFRNERIGVDFLYINGLYVSNTYPFIGEAMVNLPLAFEPEPGPKNVLVIGLGVGESLRYRVSAGHHMTVVELHAPVVKMFRELNSDGPAVLASPLAKVVLNDGRNFLASVAARYDLILVDGSPPLYASGMVNLYAREFAQLAKDHLTDQGLFVIWFPVICFPSDFWSVMRGLTDTFPSVLVYSPPGGSNAMLLSAKADAPLWPMAEGEPGARLSRGNRSGSGGPEKYVGGFVLSQAEIRRRAASYPAVTDDTPTTEFPLQGFLRGETYYDDNRFLYDRGPPAGGPREDRKEAR